MPQAAPSRAEGAPMDTIKRVPFLLLTLLAFTACASGRGDDPFDEPDGPTILEVENRSTFLMTIYVVRESGERRRIGQAQSLTTTKLTIPSSLMFGITSLRFQADPVGSRTTPISHDINVSPGDTVVLVIPPR